MEGITNAFHIFYIYWTRQPSLPSLEYKAMKYKAEYKQQLPESDLKCKGKPVKASDNRSVVLTVGHLVESTLFKPPFLEAFTF